MPTATRPGWTPSGSLPGGRETTQLQLRAISHAWAWAPGGEEVWGSQESVGSSLLQTHCGALVDSLVFTGGADGQTDVWTSTAGGGQMARMTVVPAPPHQEESPLPSPTAREEAVPHPQPTWNPLSPPLLGNGSPTLWTGFYSWQYFSCHPCPPLVPVMEAWIPSLVPWKWPQKGQFLQPRGPVIPRAFLCYMFLAMLSLHCGAQTLVAKHGLEYISSVVVACGTWA